MHICRVCVRARAPTEMYANYGVIIRFRTNVSIGCVAIVGCKTHCNDAPLCVVLMAFAGVCVCMQLESIIVIKMDYNNFNCHIHNRTMARARARGLGAISFGRVITPITGDVTRRCLHIAACVGTYQVLYII